MDDRHELWGDCKWIQYKQMVKDESCEVSGVVHFGLRDNAV